MNEFLETRNLNQDALENTFGAILLYCGSNNNPTVGQFVDALKTVIINGLAYRILCCPNFEGDGASLLDKLHSFLKPSNASSTSPSTSHDNETTGSVPDIVHIGKEAQGGVSASVHAYDVKMFSLAYVIGFIAKRLLNPLNAELNPICHLLAFFGAHHILHIRRIRVNNIDCDICKNV
jgi:hypothetical protein